MHELNYFFSWPYGQVWPNLIASALWAAPSIYFIYRKVERSHRQREERIHQHIDEHFAKLTDEDIDS